LADAIWRTLGLYNRRRLDGGLISIADRKMEPYYEDSLTSTIGNTSKEGHPNPAIVPTLYDTCTDLQLLIGSPSSGAGDHLDERATEEYGYGHKNTTCTFQCLCQGERLRECSPRDLAPHIRTTHI